MRNTVHKLLHWAEKIFKTDIVYLTRGFFWLASSQLVTAGLTLLLATALARFLPKEIYGNYKYIISLAGLIGALMLSGMDTVIIRSVARGFEGVVHRALGLYARFSLLGSGVALASALYYFINGNDALALSLVIVGIGLPIFQTSILFQSILTGHKEFKLTAKYNIIANLIPTALLIIAATLFNDNVPFLVLVYFIGYSATNYILLRLTLKRFPPNDKLDEQDITYGKHLSVMNVLGTIGTHIDKVLIFQLIGAVDVAIYAFAEALPNQIRRLFRITGSLISPKLSANHNSLTFKNILCKALFFTVAVTTLVLIYIATAKLIFTLLFPAYTEAILFSQLLALQLIPMAFGYFSLEALKACRAKKKLYLYKITAPLINIILLAGLIYLYGIWGAIYARLIGRSIAATLAIALFYLNRRSQKA